MRGMPPWLMPNINWPIRPGDLLGSGRRRRFALCAALFGAAFGAPFAMEKAAHAAEPMVGIRSLAMGDSLRGLASGAEGTLLNPSGIAVTRQFAATGFYSLRAQSLGHFLHASVSDSVTQKYLALGVYNSYFHETPHFSYLLPEGGASNRVVLVRGNDIVRTGNEAGIVIAVPFGDRFAIGGTLKYGYYSLRSQLHAADVPPDFTYQNPLIDGDHSVDLGSAGHVISFDVGATLRLFEELRIGVVGHNLWAHAPELPTRLGIGLSYRFSERLLVAADAVIDFNGTQMCTAFAETGLCSDSQQRTTYRLGGGGEYVAAGVVPLRLGYLYDGDLGAHHVSGGLGYFDSARGFSLDLSLRQQVSGGTETVALIGFRILKQ
jgi:hypothetical protein